MIEALRNTVLAGVVTFTGIACTEPTPTQKINTGRPLTTSIFESAPAYPSLTPTEPNPTIVIPELTQSPEPLKTPETPFEKPNIVVIMLDDINPIDGRLWDYMPSMHSTFVEKGVEFDEYYDETPLCCPARVGFLTGQHTQNHGVIDNKLTPLLFNDHETLATELQNAGYFTGIFGKYLNNFINLKDKTPRGWDKQAIIDGYNTAYFNYNLKLRNGSEEYHGNKPKDYSTDVFANKAVGFIRNAPKNKPIFAYITPAAVHGPNTPAPRDKNNPTCKNIEPWKPGGYNERDVSDKPKYVQERGLLNPNGYDLIKTCETLQSVDDLIRRVTQELQRQGRFENTIFILTGDNGMAWGDHRMDKKNNPYAVRLPLFISWPAVRGTEPAISHVVISNIDVAPMLAEAARVKMGPYPNGQKKADGISFYPELKGATTDPNIRLDRDVILESDAEIGVPIPAWWGLQTTADSEMGKWQYIHYKSGELELYNLNSDPDRMTNLARNTNFRNVINYFEKKLNRLKKPFK